jgi:divalent metal cation (Fe/Co/Zn/Cd) transporter
MPNNSTRTVLVAIGADVGVALAKVGTAVFTGSSAVAAGAAEALADTDNDVFLLIAQRRGGRPADEEEKARAFLLAYPGVTAIRQLLATFIGPGRVWIVARLDIDDGLSGAQVKSLVRGIESGMKHESEHIYRVDVVPIGGLQAVPQPTAR